MLNHSCFALQDLLEKDFKITVNDDTMTDDDSDMDEEQDTFMGLAHEVHTHHLWQQITNI